MATVYRYPLSNGKTLTLEGDNEPATSQVEEIARQQGVSLSGLETPSARKPTGTGTSDRRYIDEAQDFLNRNPYFKSPGVSTGPQNFEQPEDEGGGLLNSIYKGATTPLTHYLPGDLEHIGSKFSDYMTTPKLNDSRAMAMFKGLIGGMGEGTANVANDFTSPANIAMMAATGQRAPNLLKTIGKMAAVPGMVHGGSRVLDPESTLGERGQGAFELAMNALGYKGIGAKQGVNTLPKDVPFDLPLHEAPPSSPDLPLKGGQPRGTPYDLPIRQPNTGFDLPLNPFNNPSRGLEYPLPPERNIPSDLPMGPRDEGPLLDLPLNQPSNIPGDLPLNTNVPSPVDLPLRPPVNPSVAAPIANPQQWSDPNLQVGRRPPISFNEQATPTPEPTPTPDNNPRAGVTTDPYQTMGDYLKEQRLNELRAKSKDGTITAEEMAEGNKLLGVTEEPTQSGLPMDHPNAWGLTQPQSKVPIAPPNNLSQGGLPFDRNFAPELGNTPSPEPPKVELTPQQKQARLDEIITKAQEGPLSIEEFREGNALHQELSSTPKPESTLSKDTGTSNDLPKGKLRYNTGKKSFTLDFADDVDKSLLALGGKNDAAHLKNVMEKTGLDEAGARKAAKNVRAAVKSQLQGHEGGVAKIEPIHNASKKNETIELPEGGVSSIADWLPGGKTRRMNRELDNIKDTAPVSPKKSFVDRWGESEGDPEGVYGDKLLESQQPQGTKIRGEVKDVTDSLFAPKMTGTEFDIKMNNLNRLMNRAREGKLSDIELQEARLLDKELRGMNFERPIDTANDSQKTIELTDDEGVSSMNWKDTRNLDKGEGTSKTTVDPQTGETIDLNTGEVIPPNEPPTGSESTGDPIADALKLKGQLEDVKAKPPSGQVRPTPSMAASLPVGAKMVVSSKTFTPKVMAKLYEMGFDHDGLTDLGNHRFVKATNEARQAPILETEVGLSRPKATPKKEEQTAIGEITNFSRSVMASIDMSAPLRQGIGLAHRKEFWNALPGMVKSWGSEAVYNGVMADINSRAMFKTRQGVGGTELPSFAQDAGLKLTNMYDLASREESFMSNLAGKLPGVQRSERAYSAFLNKLRADTFEALVKDGKVFGADSEVNIAMAREIANFVNTATGRGSLGSLEQSARALNNTFFAPRLIASRLTMLNPMTYVNANPMVRKEYLKSLFTIVGAGMGVGQLAKMAGAKVETDSTSSDFGKINIGGIRIDPYAGFQQYAVAAKRLMPHWATLGKPTNTGILPLDLMTGFMGTPGGYTKSSTTNNKYELGSGFGKPTKLDVIERFGTGKLNPVWSFAAGILKGKNLQGQPFDVPEELASRMLPLIVQDIKELATEDPNLIPGIHRKNPYKEFHPENLPFAIPPFFGAGVQPYSEFKR